MSKPSPLALAMRLQRENPRRRRTYTAEQQRRAIARIEPQTWRDNTPPARIACIENRIDSIERRLRNLEAKP